MIPARRSGSAPSPLLDDGFLRKLEYLHVVSRRVFAGRTRGERRTRKVGSGIEFADHRDYAPGDDLRLLDWNVYGRLDRLLIRLFEEEEDLHIHLLVDASASMGTATGGGISDKLRYAARTAAALCYVGLANLDRVGISALTDGAVTSLPAARGKGRIFTALDFLGALRPHGRTKLRDAVGSFVHRTRRRGLAVLISDLYDPDGYREAVDLLLHHRFEPTVVQVFDPRDAEPVLRGDLALVDCETGEQREVTVSGRVLAAYRKAHAAFLDEVATFCASRQVPCFRAPIDVPFEDMVLRMFRTGGILR